MPSMRETRALHSQSLKHKLKKCDLSPRDELLLANCSTRLAGPGHRESFVADCTAVQPLHRRQTGFSSFRRHLLEQSSTTRDTCTVARDAIFRQRLETFLFHLSHPDYLLICSLLRIE